MSLSFLRLLGNRRCLHARKALGRHHHKKLACEQLEERRVLATLSVNVAGENPSSGTLNDGDLTLREAIIYVNQDSAPQSQDLMQIDDFGGTEPLGTNDKIVFESSVTGSIILTLGEIDRWRSRDREPVR